MCRLRVGLCPAIGSGHVYLGFNHPTNLYQGSGETSSPHSGDFGLLETQSSEVQSRVSASRLTWAGGLCRGCRLRRDVSGAMRRHATSRPGDGRRARHIRAAARERRWACPPAGHRRWGARRTLGTAARRAVGDDHRVCGRRAVHHAPERPSRVARRHDDGDELSRPAHGAGGSTAQRACAATGAPARDDAPDGASLTDAAAAARRADPEITDPQALVDYLQSLPSAFGLFTAVDDAGVVRATSGSGAFGTTASVIFVNTDPGWRRRGIALAMTATALRSAEQSGARHAGLDASDAGRELYVRLGFQAATPVTRFSPSA